jgi:hypothetical protein
VMHAIDGATGNLVSGSNNHVNNGIPDSLVDPNDGQVGRRFIVQAVHNLWDLLPASSDLCWDDNAVREGTRCCRGSSSGSGWTRHCSKWASGTVLCRPPAWVKDMRVCYGLYYHCPLREVPLTLWLMAALNAYFEHRERVALDESQSRTSQRMEAPSIQRGCNADRFAIINIVYYSSLCTVLTFILITVSMGGQEIPHGQNINEKRIYHQL